MPIDATESPRGNCTFCGSADHQEGWTEFALTIEPGPRGPMRESFVPLVVEGLLCCPTCYLAPESGTLRAAVEHKWAAPLESTNGCLIRCVRPVMRVNRLVAKAMGESKPRCPACYGPAHVELTNEVPRRARRRGRWRGRGALRYQD